MWEPFIFLCETHEIIKEQIDKKTVYENWKCLHEHDKQGRQSAPQPHAPKSGDVLSGQFTGKKTFKKAFKRIKETINLTHNKRHGN